MKATCLVGVALIAVALALSGCGRRAGLGPGAVSLPEWAPKNPSPEFLRAAKVLKPVPPERMPKPLGNLLAPYASIVYPASYEFFGTLRDQQIQEFLAAKEIRIPVNSLTRLQRAALDAWFAAFRDAMKGGPPQFSDYLAILYNMGGKEDFSNVLVGFQAQRGHFVHIIFWVTPPGGKEDYACTSFAEI